MKKNMRKQVAFFITASAVTLTGCGSLSEKSVQKDPEKAVREASVISNEAILGKIDYSKLMKNSSGTYQIDFNSNLLTMSALVSQDENVRTDMNFKTTFLGGTYDVDVYRNGCELAVANKYWLGDTTYGINLDTFIEELKSTKIFELMGMGEFNYDALPEDQKVMIETMVNTYRDLFKMSGSQQSELQNKYRTKLIEDIKSVMKSADISVGSETKEYADGSADVINVTYKLSTENVKQMVSSYLDLYMDMMNEINPDFMTNYFKALGKLASEENIEGIQDFDLETSKQKVAEAIDTAGLNMDITYSLNKKTKGLSEIVVVANGTEEQNPVSAKVTCTFGADAAKTKQMNVKVDFNQGEEKNVCNLTYDANTHKYTLNIVDLADAEGEFAISESSVNMSLDKITLAKQSEDTMDLSEYNMKYTYNKEYEMKEMPAYKNVFQLTQEDLQAIFSKFGF